MRILSAVIVLCLATQISFGQACGKYFLKYVGTIKCDSIEVKSIKLPTIMFLHGLRKQKSDYAFIEINPNDNQIECCISSHLTSVFTDEFFLLELYKRKRPSLPIIITLNNEEKEITKEISWENIKMRKIEDDKYGIFFELDLKEIVIEAIPVQDKEIGTTAALIQKILDLPKLQWIYHPKFEGRLPVKILKTKLIRKNLNLNKFGRKVRIMSLRELEKKGILDYIIFDKLDIKNDTAYFELSYKIEGVGCSGRLSKETGEWTIIDYSVWENK